MPPPTARDVLTQHLAIPKLYIQHHGIYNLPFLEASYNPMQLDMVYILSLLLGSEESASLIHFTFALMTGSLIYLLLSRFGPRWFAWITALLFLSTPMVFSLSSKAYVDLGLTFYSFAAIYGIVQTDNKKKWLSVSAIFVGLAAASKYNGFLVVIILCFWATLEAKEGGFGAALGHGLKYFLIALAVVSPWLIRNYFYSGNPIFPFLSDRMGNLIPIERESYSILTQRMLLYGENWMDFFAIPFRLFFQGEDESPRFFDGILNPVFLLLSPLAFWGNSDKWKFRMAGFVVLYFIFSLFLVEMRTRYVLPTLGPLAVLTGLGWARLRALRQGRLWAAIPFIFFFLNASYMLSYAQKADIGPYILGKESREDYLSRKLSDFDLWQYANGHLPENSRVMMYFMGNRGYYSDREYCYESFYSGKQLKQALSRSPSVESLGRYFREKGITHIAWRVDLFTSFIDSNLLPREKAAFDEFVLRHLTLVFEAKGYQLLRVKG